MSATGVDTAAPVRAERPRPGPDPGWRIVAEQECRDLWWGGRGPVLLLAFSILLSVVTYLTATNNVLNYLEQRETVSLTVQVAVAVSALLTLIVSADGISGERERGTLEVLLVAPVAGRSIAAGKLAAALSLWLATFVVSVPYIWALGQGVSVVGRALLLDAVVGGLVAIALASLGLLISALAGSNRVSLSVSLFLLLALFAPTQLPTGAQQGWFGDLLVRVNPIAAGERYVALILVNGHGWTRELPYLLSPVAAAAVAVGVLVATGTRVVRLFPGLGER